MPGFEVFGVDERRAVDAVFEGNNGVLFAHGFVKQRKGVFKVRELEQEAARAFDVAHVQATSSGSTALWCAMRALGVRPGDEVITQAFTFVATVEAILLCGAKPVVVDIDASLNMDPAALAAAITPKTRLIVPVHMAGVAARMREILSIAAAHRIPVLEDAAQAAGGRYYGRALGTLASAGVISLDFGKMITCGEGGLVLTSERTIFEEARAFHDHGHEYNHAVQRGLDTRHTWGFNARMTELQAAVAIVQLRKLPDIVAAHRRNKARLKNRLATLNLPISFRDVPDPDGDNGDTLFFFARDARAAGRVVNALNDAGIGTKNVPDAINWHFAGAWDHMLGGQFDRPLTEVFKASAQRLERTVSVPIWINAEDAWFDTAVDAVAEGLS
jgi:8-amino-3,8-dideoxy-alpha-D-manno-octulosonate transaminase